VPYPRTQAVLNFRLDNRVEIKVASKKDTITGTKKVVIFENVSLGTAYDFARDSLRWIPFYINGRTTLFKLIYLSFNIVFDPYSIDMYGNRSTLTELKANKRLLRLSRSEMNLSVGLPVATLIRNLMTQKTKTPPPEDSDITDPLHTQSLLGTPQMSVDFKQAWNLNLNYTLAYTVNDNLNYYRRSSLNPNLYYDFDISNPYEHRVIQTLNVAGDLNITSKWRLGFTTGYDFVQKGISFTSLDIYRDLHCWEMRFNWIPFGIRKGWNFTINIKSATLKDVKWNKKKDFRDQF
jgi:hypothetical protein